ncbi:hypothetical protein H5V43_04050 [Sphingobium fuliginis]|jgi:hypothetical protein|uniref:Uncharacterized protein n=1 Tax=Sphingobium fuliginis (strain ATCC 27551) TaxID=336203 RepID=A0A7M2GKP1_SPHSA|nr:hypothetical protein [Sphingobium fuliginis]QOT73103.1 hypothetical protein H5V43_04050 [Sphingobium fuliginis]
MRLIHDLAVRRILYRRPIPTMPDILVIDIPPRYAAPSLPLGRYYPIIIETRFELDEIETFLAAERDFPVVPDLFDRRPSALTGGDIVFCHYAAPAPEWPLLLLCHWPANFTVMVPPTSDSFARGCYTTAMFESIDALDQTEDRLLTTLGRHHPVIVKPIGTAHPAGHA